MSYLGYTQYLMYMPNICYFLFGFTALLTLSVVYKCIQCRLPLFKCAVLLTLSQLCLFLTSIYATVVYFQNEDTLKTCVNDYMDKLKQQEERYQTLKKTAEEKLAK